MYCHFTLDGQPFDFEIEGELETPSDEVLFLNKDQHLRDLPWMDKGYTRVPLFDPGEFSRFQKSIFAILKKIGKELQFSLPAYSPLENYHHQVNSDKLHQKVIEKTRFLTVEDFNIDIEELASRLSEKTGKKLSVHNPLLTEEIIILRINRPGSYDINPFHRDGYLDIWKNVLNVWIPIAGCGPLSNLSLIPGSHLWNEKDVVRTKSGGASINGQRYHVPAVVSSTHGLNAVRSDVQYGEALIFTPYIIHGAAFNRTDDTTRMSLELRFYIES
jgi:hypothetical protein